MLQTLRLHMQTVGPAASGSELFPDFVFGGWWHIGLHDFDPFVRAMAIRAQEPAIHAQAFWIGNLEMSSTRRDLKALSMLHPDRIDARGITWQHQHGNVSEETGERAATDKWVTLQALMPACQKQRSETALR